LHDPGEVPPLSLDARHRRRAAAFAAATVTAYIPLDMWVGAGLDTAAVRIAWVAVLLGLGWAPRQARDWHPNLLGVLSAAALTAIVHQTGGAASVYVGYLYALPLAVLVLYPDWSRAGVLTGIATLVAGTAMLAAQGVSPRTVVAFGGVVVSSIFLVAFGGRAFREARDAERAAAAARRTALEELAESERRRAQAERLALVGQLAAGVAHEVNNPLSYVKTSLGVVLDLTAPLDLPAAEREELSGAVADALDGLARIQAIVSDLRAFARGDDNQPDGCDATHAVEEALRVASVRVSRVARVAADLPPGERRVAIPRGRLVQALVNVLLNAADAIEGGRGGQVRVALRDEPDACLIEVEDDGPGVPPEVAPRLFEPFFTTKGARGTGLGLSLSREYLARYGASIAHAPAPSGGALFKLRLPLARARSAA
jgi:signal transduction histidine kinase